MGKRYLCFCEIGRRPTLEKDLVVSALSALAARWDLLVDSSTGIPSTGIVDNGRGLAHLFRDQISHWSFRFIDCTFDIEDRTSVLLVDLGDFIYQGLENAVGGLTESIKSSTRRYDSFCSKINGATGRHNILVLQYIRGVEFTACKIFFVGTTSTLHCASPYSD